MSEHDSKETNKVTGQNIKGKTNQKGQKKAWKSGESKDTDLKGQANTQGRNMDRRVDDRLDRP